ncbi:hypothetical protein [Roseomonas marmotae]|uniref:Uncharacterized protein n=1 Tax=Roseomonas marmotae TaxID=2768161 RepID=A0ABS3K7B5_9PROT|nr:hypothetical protein [Roseomonas marmotae]MBO1073361.1 hypothetical protein [Roseomonas marmotae]
MSVPPSSDQMMPADTDLRMQIETGDSRFPFVLVFARPPHNRLPLSAIRAHQHGLVMQSIPALQQPGLDLLPVFVAHLRAGGIFLELHSSLEEALAAMPGGVKL